MNKTQSEDKPIEDVKANQKAVKDYEKEIKRGKTDRELLDEWNEEREDIEYNE